MNTSLSRTSTVSGILSCLLACLFATAAVAKEKAPENWDGLERVKVKGLDHVYRRPNVQFEAYKTVQLVPTRVEFSKHWERSFDFSNRPDASDIERIKGQVAALMHKSFSEELVKHGYTLVETPGADTLQVSTAIIELFINAPELNNPGITRTYTTSAGRMTLVLEARDGPTGQLLARVVDKKEDDSIGGRMEWTTSASNSVDARRMMDDWAKRLRESLDRLNGKVEAK